MESNKRMADIRFPIARWRDGKRNAARTSLPARNGALLEPGFQHVVARCSSLRPRRRYFSWHCASRVISVLWSDQLTAN